MINSGLLEMNQASVYLDAPIFQIIDCLRQELKPAQPRFLGLVWGK